MQAKHLIIIALAGIVILIGFNMFNSYSHEQSRAAMVDNSGLNTISTDTVSSDTISLDITSQPLGEQPKAIIDSATKQIEQAGQANLERVAQTGTIQ